MVTNILFTDLDATHNIGLSSFIAALIIGGTEIFFHIYMKKLVLRNDDNLRNHNHIRHDKYAMEMSDEYIDSSTINKSILRIHQKKKVANATFYFCLLLDLNFLHVTAVELPTLFSYLNVATLHLPALFHMKLSK